ncbi:MAG: hypothetical protein GX862_11265 [Leucobacter sp.]|nr:hypothetical protein [Leucobacter sp.]
MSYRVIQWATGAMGTAVLRTLLDDGRMNVVGAFVYSDKKAGTDVGTLARRPDTGVAATNNVDEILALEADVVVHAARLGVYGSHDAEIIQLLESGKNVLSINGYSNPAWRRDERYERLEAACQRGGTTLMGVGLNPGFIGEQAAVLASGLSTNIERIEISEAADARLVQDPDYFFGALGFGSALDDTRLTDPGSGPAAALNGMYEETLATIARHLGASLDAVETEHVMHPALSDIEVSAGTVRAGSVGHTQWQWHGIVGGERLITMTIHWFVETAHLPESAHDLWHVKVTGQPGVDMRIDLSKHAADRSRMGAEQYALGAQVLHAIPLVVRAPAGVLMHPPVIPANLPAS